LITGLAELLVGLFRLEISIAFEGDSVEVGLDAYRIAIFG